jgi:hypothetical protein
VKKPLALLLLASLTACGDSQTPVVEARPVAEASAENCVDRFVQEFEESTPDVPAQDVRNACFDTTPPDGLPKFPSSSRKVRLEYDRGDYFVVQESVSWLVGDDFDAGRGCIKPRLTRMRVVERVQGGVKESMVTEDGETKRSADTGKQYGGRILMESGTGWMPTHTLVSPDSPVSDVVREESPYGTCLRALVGSSTICSLEQGHSCKSANVMLPIEIRIPNANGGGTQVGRTTSLDRAAPDRSAWVVR